MAVQAITTNPFASLLARRGVSVLSDRPVPREATVQAVIIAGIRFFELRGPSRSGPVTVHWHPRDNRWVELTSHPGLWCTNRLMDVGRQLSPPFRRYAAIPACRAGSSG